MSAIKNKVFRSYPFAVQEALLPHMRLREVQDGEKIIKTSKESKFVFSDHCYLVIA